VMVTPRDRMCRVQVSNVSNCQICFE
jgi:hypothetical protein